MDPSAKVTRYPGTATGEVNLNDGRFDNTWMGFMGQETQANPAATAQPRATAGATSGAIADDSSWRNRLYAERAASQNRSYARSTSVAGPAPKNVQPVQAMKAPDLPEYEGIGEYAPPEEDEGVYKTARREAMGAGMRELREGTREAISSAQSLDNPNARSKFIRQSLKGYGQGLENVAAGAAREGRTEARDKRREQLDLYKTNYDIRSDTYLKNYQNTINTIASNFASEQAAQAQNTAMEMNPNLNVVGQGGSGSGVDPRSLGNQQPFMGYMA
jgi:hypothetical protein